MPKLIKQEDNIKRQDIINKLLDILDINKDNDSFLLSVMDSDINKQKKIYELEDDIRKYYLCGKWSCFCKPTKRRWLSIIKNICKEEKINMITCKIKIKDELTNTNKEKTFYKIIKL